MRLAPALLVVASLLPACPLPSTVRYRCEADRTCAVPGTQCGADGYCHPTPGTTEDGGVPCDPSLDLAARCAEVECGVVANGCGDELDCGKWCQGGLWCGTQQRNTCGLPQLCTPEGWCWENPLPQGYTLNAGFRLDLRHTWFVGENRTVLRFDGEQLFDETPAAAPGQSLLDVHGTTAEHVFAVGRGGLILHRAVSGEWEVENISPASAPTLRAVLSLGDGRALAGGGSGTVYYRVPNAAPAERWRQVTQTLGADVVDLALDGDGEAWALTRTSGLFKSSGDFTSWTLVDTPPLTEGRQVVVHQGALYVAGGEVNNRGVQRRDPSADGGYVPLVSGNGGGQVVSLFSNEGTLWAISGGGGFVIDADGGLPFSFNDAPWAGGTPAGGGAGLLVGLNGAMGLRRADGGTLLLSTPRTNRGANLGAVCGSAPEVMFAAGAREGTTCSGQCIVRFARRQVSSAGVRWQWEDAELGGTSQLLACYALGPEDFWLPGDDTKFVYWGGGADAGWGWGDFTGTYGGVYTAAWGLPDAGFYFARTGSTELTWSADGLSNWLGVGVASPTPLRGVWGTGGDDIVAVGLQGSVSRFDGTSWVNVPNVAVTDFQAVHGARLADGNRRYVAVGTNGIILSSRSDGGRDVAALGGAVTMRQAWVSSTGAAWAVGTATDGGAWVVRSDFDQPWLTVPFGSPRSLTGVYGFDEADGGQSLWVSGPAGLLMRKR